jgi:RNA polymerase sigma-70 factor, ECF subfamily
LDNALTSQASETPAPESNWDATNLIAEHQSGVWRYLRSIGCDHTLADDLTQETFIAVIRRPFVQVSPAATSSYLRRVAYHLLISYRRRQKKVSTTSELSMLDSQWMRWAGDSREGGDDVYDALVDCFERLTERAQLSLRMRFADDASREAIAEQLGITEHGAKNLMQRAKAQLKLCLDGKINRE